MNNRRTIAELRRNLCVTAGAGAGKTSSLVQAYLGLLIGNETRPPLEPGRIVAITFTEKAAAEMRARVMAAATERATEEGGPWRELLPSLEWAPISTIHSFCAGLLRESGATRGIDPDFAILDGDQYQEMLERAVQALLRRALGRGDTGLELLLRHYPLDGKWGVAGLLAWLHHGLATMGLGAAAAAEATALAHDAAIGRARALAGELIDVLDELRGVVLADAALKKSKAAFAAALLGFAGNWPDLRDRLTRDPFDEAAALGIDTGLGANRGGSAEIGELRRRAKDMARELAAAASLGSAAALSEALLALAGELEADLGREKARLSALGFDDLLVEALALLAENPTVLAELRGRYGALLVDEFQDVNPVQGRLVQLLCGLGEGEPSGDGPLLLVVGDRKQSIYAFRGADVRFFAQTMRGFEHGGWGALVALERNFRSEPGLIGFFNHVFAAVFGSDDQDGLAFRPDDCQRPGRDAYPSPSDTPVEILDCVGLAPPEADAAQWRAVEARAVANRLAELLEHGLCRPGDVAILLRRLTQVQVYEQALKAAGVDYYTVRGRGFFGCREIADVAQALAAIQDPGDELAVLGLLRSPLVGLSDESLLALVQGPEGRRSLSQALLGQVLLPDWCGSDQAARLARAVALVGELGPAARRVAPAGLITELAARTDLEAVLLATPGGGQKAANLRKLIETARDYRHGPVRYVRELRAMLAQERGDPQAPLLSEDGGVVRLMTIHQAKGLQFPVVVLCDMAAGRAGAAGMPGPGPGGVISLRPMDFARGSRPENPIHRQLADQRAAVENAEAARLLYVACTRAEKRLIIARTMPKRRGIWAKWLEEHIMEAPGAALVPGRLEARGPAKADDAPGQDELALEARAAGLVARCLAPRVVVPPLVRLSVSGMEDWLECPRRFIFTQRLGLDTACLPGRGAGPGPAARAVALGSLVHGLLEHADLRLGAAGMALPPGADPELAAEALDRARGFMGLDLARGLAALPAEAVLREQPFLMRLGGRGEDGPILELKGEMDLVAPDGHGGWCIVDYKVSASLDAAKYRDQMLIYATAWWRATGREAVPRVFLAHLGPRCAKAHEMGFGTADLAAMEQRLRAAARGIADLGDIQDPGHAPRGTGCGREKCPLGPICPE